MSAERLAYSDSESSSTIVQALCRDLATGTVNLNIHPDDEMLLFFLYSQGNSFEQAVALYLDSGRRIWRALRQVICWKFGSPSAGVRILDFASGYGRVTRHIVAEVPRERVWVSDIYAEGVAFQERQFGVRGIVSATDPECFRPETTFDCILVSSLFTHLPAPRFLGWLGRLGSLLSPGGMLLFSVHDLSLRRGVPPPASGIAFEAVSESGSLAVQEYGTTWVGEEYVRAAVAEAIGKCALHRIPRGLANFQDLYVVLAGAHDGALPSAAPFAGLRVVRDLDGFVEHCSRFGKRGLRLSGWLGDRVTGRPPQEVRVSIDGALVAFSRRLEPRSTEVFAADPMTVVGWEFTVDLPAGADADLALLSIRAIASDGEERELLSDSVLGALLRSAQFDLFTIQSELAQESARREAQVSGLNATIAERQGSIAELNLRIDELQRQIRGMEASRFWKMRNHWFRLKRLAGLTAES